MKTAPLAALFILALSAAASLRATPEPFVPSGPMVRIWPGAAPGSEGKTAPERWIEGGAPDAFHRVTDIHVPTLTVYLPDKAKANGTAVIIAPGGAHRYLVVDLEGEFVAKKLNEMGIAAFVLRSRLARADGSTYRAEVESLADIQQAVRVVRARAAEWNVNPNRVGLMGFSAGGHLVALALSRDDKDAAPNFAVLSYPGWSEEATPLPKINPPVFLWVNDDDRLATIAGKYYLELRKAGIPTEFHVFPHGGHGVGMTGRGPGFEKLAAAHWPELLRGWLDGLGLLR